MKNNLITFIFFAIPLVTIGQNINFQDSEVKRICVSKWDSDKDGELSKSEAAAVSSIGTAFRGKASIKSFNELKYFTGLTTISAGAFSSSTIKSVVLPEQITSLEKDAFLYCRSLTSIHLPAKVQAIGQNALSGCSAMTSITVAWGNSSFCDIDGVLFTYDKTQLLQFPAAKATTYTVPEGTKVIARDAFYESGLVSVTLPETITELVYDAFGYSEKLTGLTIPEGVSIIGDYILDHCVSLKTLRIPASVQTIGQRITNDCNSITDVYCYSKNPFAIINNNFTTKTYENATLHVLYGTEELYASLDGWKNFKNIVGMEDPDPNIIFEDENVKEICVSNWDTNEDGELSMSEAASIKGNLYGFTDNTSITSFNELQYFTGLVWIDGGQYLDAFAGCTNLKTIRIPKNVREIRDGAFSGCVKLESIKLENVSFIGRYVFGGCTNLKSIGIPANVEVIKYNAFGGCTSLKSIYIDNLEAWCNIQYETSFYEDWGDHEINLPESGNASPLCNGADLYLNGTKLTNLIIPDNLPEINKYSFYHCTSITNVVIPEGVEKIGFRAFMGCSNLQSVTIPSSITEFGNSIWNECEALSDIYYSSYDPIAINSNNFSEATYQNATLHVPYGFKKIYEKTDGWKNFANIADDIETSIYVKAEGSNMRMKKHVDISVGIFSENGRYNGYQFDISLPEGFQLQENNGKYEYTLSDRFNDVGIRVNIKRLSNGSYRVIVYSSTNTRIINNDGELIRLVAVADKNLEAGEYDGLVYNVQLSKTNGESVPVNPGTFSLAILPYDIGDVNIDGVVDVSDVMVVVNHILGNTLLFYHGEYADMNGDGVVDVTDVMLIVNVILDPDMEYAPTIPTRGGLSLKTEGDQTIVSVPFASEYTACQMTVRLSEGMRLLSTRLFGNGSGVVCNNCKVRTSMLSDGSWRIMIYSSDGAPLRSSNKGLFCLNTSGKGQMTLGDVMFTTVQCESVAFSDVTTPTGISDAGLDTSPTSDIYDLGGRRHTTTPKQSGIYIKNGKLRSIKK